MLLYSPNNIRTTTERVLVFPYHLIKYKDYSKLVFWMQGSWQIRTKWRVFFNLVKSLMKDVESVNNLGPDNTN